MQRIIQFKTRDNAGATEIINSVRNGLKALDRHKPGGVRLAYWRLTDSNDFIALIELSDPEKNPLFDIQETRELPAAIGEKVEGGYPKPRLLELLGAYGFDL